jgi:hypothetical protein
MHISADRSRQSRIVRERHGHYLFGPVYDEPPGIPIHSLQNNGVHPPPTGEPGVSRTKAEGLGAMASIRLGTLT